MSTSKRIASAYLALLCALPWAAAQAVEVGVSIGVSQPGVYGRIDIGRFPAPVLVQAAPVWVRPAPQHFEPVYLWVPAGHQRHWRKHCHRYRACGEPVYFVQEDWYRQNVMYGEYERHGRGHGGYKGHRKHRHDREDRYRD